MKWKLLDDFLARAMLASGRVLQWAKKNIGKFCEEWDPFLSSFTAIFVGCFVGDFGCWWWWFWQLWVRVVLEISPQNGKFAPEISLQRKCHLQSMVDSVDILKQTRSSPMQMQLVVVDPDDQTASGRIQLDWSRFSVKTTKKYVDQKGKKRFKGTKDLKATQTYPPGFGRAFAERMSPFPFWLCWNHQGTSSDLRLVSPVESTPWTWMVAWRDERCEMLIVPFTYPYHPFKAYLPTSSRFL